MHQLVPHFILENYASGKQTGVFPAVGLFVDVSGFSTITDALMAHGQHGAEVLAQIIRAAFSPQIRAVYEQGGFIASMAGDGFTGLFPLQERGGDGCQRALAAAWGIQQNAAAKGHYSTSYGNFTIFTKVGMAAGEVTWGIVNAKDGRRAAYYFQGSAVDGCAEAEHHANSGEIILDADLFGRIQGLVTADPVDGYQRVTAVNAALPTAQPVTLPTPDLSLMNLFFPNNLAVQRFSGEFRQVINLFINLPTVRTQSQLEIFMQTLFELQERYGGVLNGLDFGDKGSHLLLFWGAPVAHENDIERALDFLLDLQMRTAIPINGGLTYQVAHAGFVGSELREEYTTFGRGVNLAARFMTAAPRGEIWVDENIARQVKGHFDLDFVGEMRFKGFSRPQKVYNLYERKERVELGFEGRLVSREDEIQELANFVQPVFKGEFPGVLVVWGEPGMGKSRLVYEFLRDLLVNAPVKFGVFLAQTDEILRQSLNPFRYWLRNYFGVSATQVEARNKRSFNRRLDELISASPDNQLADELDRTRSFLGALVDLYWPDSLYEQIDAQGRYENTFIGLTSLLLAESRLNPIILFLEDIHWLDVDSQAFLAHLLRVLTAEEDRTPPIAVLATARFEGSGLPLEGFSYRQIDLGKLNRDALAVLAEGQLPGRAGEKLLDLLVERSDGNPFFAEQILRYLKEEGLLYQDEDGWKVMEQQAPLPMDVRAVLVARLDRLAQEVKEVVQTASVLGREFEVCLLELMLDEREELPSRLAQAEQSSIWVTLSEIRYLFKHALLRDTAYRMQLRARRQALHSLAVEAIEEVYADRLSSQYGELAYHSERAGLVDKARKYLKLAGDAARQVYQNQPALQYYNKALSLTPDNDLDARFELLNARLAIYELLGDSEKREQDLAGMQQLALTLEEIDKKAYVSLRQCQLFFDRGDFQQAIEAARQTISMAIDTDQVEIAIGAYSIAASSFNRQNKPELATEHIEKGLELARASNDRLNESRLINSLGMLALEQRNLAQARSCFERSLNLAQEGGNLLAQSMPLANLGSVAGYQGDFTAAKNYYEQSLALAREIGKRSGEGLILGNLGWISGIMGEYEKARAYAEQNLQIARQVGDPYSEAYALINLSSYNGALEDYETALNYALQGQALARRIREPSSEAWASTYIGHCRLAQGEIEAAATAYQEALDIREKFDQPLLATEPLAGLAQTALDAGDLSTARARLNDILAFLDSNGSLEGTDEPMRVYLICYKVLEQTGDPRAREILQTAYDLLQAHAANIQDQSARNAFLENIRVNREILAAWQKYSRPV